MKKWVKSHIISGRLLIWVTSLLLFSCVAEDIEYKNEGNTDDLIRFSANVSSLNNTRDNHYIESGRIEEGTYGVLFKRDPQLTDGWNRPTFVRGVVEFGNEEGPTTGFAYYYDGDRKRDLKWMKVYGHGASTEPFYIHNIPNPEQHNWNGGSDHTGSVVYFNQVDKRYPYSFFPLDKINGSNDLLVGTASANNKTEIVDVPLNHVLSLLEIKIDVYPSEDGDYTDLSNASMTLDGILNNLTTYDVAKPAQFTASDASPTIGRVQAFKKVTLVSPEVSSILSWDGEPVYDQEENKFTYSSKEFIVIPQTVPYSNNPQPRLSIKVPAKDVHGSSSQNDSVVYEGTIPISMFDADEDGRIIGNDPSSLAFNSGYRLTITASIDSPNTELTFSPAKSTAWVNKGTFNITPKQAGIYKPEQFYAMLETFNSLIDFYEQQQDDDIDIATENQMLQSLNRFGYRDSENNFVVQFWADVSLELDKIQSKMKEIDKFPFYFLFNNYTIDIVDNSSPDNSLRDSEGEFELYSIVTGNHSNNFKGINSKEEFDYLIEQLLGKNILLPEIREYGTLNNGDNTVSFMINASFSKKIDDIFQKLPETYLGKTLFFNVAEGHEIKIDLPLKEGGSESFITSQDSEYNYLNKFMLKGTPGVSSELEYHLLHDSYTKYYESFPDLLNLFGSYSSTNNRWTFQFYDVFTLSGEDVFLKMRPEDHDGVDFVTNINSGCQISIEDLQIPCKLTYSTNSSTALAAMLKGDGKSDNSSTIFSSLVSFYSTNTIRDKNYSDLWRFGRFENNKWIFTINISTTSYSYVGYSTIFGRMLPDVAAGKFDYEFILNYPVEVRSVPMDLSGLSTTTMTFKQTTYTDEYPSDAKAFKRIADGTYWEYYENRQSE